MVTILIRSSISNVNPNKKIMWQQWTNVILGILVLAVPFLNLSASVMVWTLVIAGLAIAALGLWGAQETTSERKREDMIERRT